MSETIERLRAEMEEAAQALDFERARLLRDRITLLAGGATTREAAGADTAGLRRQQPGAMGLGTGQSRVVPPDGWIPPVKPDPGTTGRSRRARGRGTR